MPKNPVVHFELPAQNMERMKDFYTKAFGWGLNQLDAEMNGYVVAHTAPSDDNGPLEKGRINGGFYNVTPEMPPQHPSVVVSVVDIMKGIEDVKAAGGTIMGESFDIPGIGKYVSFTDTEGNRLSMLQPMGM